MDKTIIASKSDVLSILHDPHQVIAQNAMFVSIVQDPSDPSWYTLNERLPLIGSWTIPTTIKTQWKETADGCDIEVHANLWTRCSNKFRVDTKESSEGTVLLTEKVVVKGLFIFMPYIVSTLVKGHRAFMDTLAAKLEKIECEQCHLLFSVAPPAISLPTAFPSDSFFAVAFWRCWEDQGMADGWLVQQPDTTRN